MRMVLCTRTGARVEPLVTLLKLPVKLTPHIFPSLEMSDNCPIRQVSPPLTSRFYLG